MHVLTRIACGHHLLLQGGELFLGNAGTAMRPLTAAVAAAGRNTFVLDGVARMRERPIQDLVDGLVQLGVDAKCTLGTGCPPVEVNANGLPSGRVSLLGVQAVCCMICQDLFILHQCIVRLSAFVLVVQKVLGASCLVQHCTVL